MARLRFTLALACALLALPGVATAATLEVTSHEERGPGSLGDTILDAGAGDTILLGPGEYPLTEGETLTAQGNILKGAGVERTTIVPTGGGEAVNSSNVVDATIAAPLQPDKEDEGSKIDTKAQVLALIATLAIFLLILDLVRRRRLVERYALLWMSSAVALVILAIWTDGLDVIADLMGIEEPANAIFILSFGIVFLLLLNFSVATSRLSEETKILAQESARLEQELREVRGESPGANGSAGNAEDPEHDRPVRAEDSG
jgi:hypothetical protein